MRKFSENDEAAADDDNDDIKDGNKNGIKSYLHFILKKNMHVMIKS